MSIGNPSRGWPYIKAIAKMLSSFADPKVPGAGVGVQILSDLQDELANDQFQDDIKAALDDIRVNTGRIVQELRRESLTVSDDRLRAAGKEVAEALYLRRLADDFVYADFKGIEQQERIASLKLDEIFVDLKAVPERTGGELATFERKRTPATKEELTETLIRQGILSRVFEFDGDGPIVARTSLSQFM